MAPAGATNTARVECKCRLFIDETGVPYKLEFEVCPALFQAPTELALMQWRFGVPKVAGSAVKVRVPITLRYDPLQ